MIDLPLFTAVVIPISGACALGGAIFCGAVMGSRAVWVRKLIALLLGMGWTYMHVAALAMCLRLIP